MSTPPNNFFFFFLLHLLFTKIRSSIQRKILPGTISQILLTSPPQPPPSSCLFQILAIISYQELLPRMFIDQQFSTNPNFSFAQNLAVLLAMENHPPTSDCNGEALVLEMSTYYIHTQR
jgi:hypothetical protein